MFHVILSSVRNNWQVLIDRIMRILKAEENKQNMFLIYTSEHSVQNNKYFLAEFFHLETRLKLPLTIDKKRNIKKINVRIFYIYQKVINTESQEFHPLSLFIT